MSYPDGIYPNDEFMVIETPMTYWIVRWWDKTIEIVKYFCAPQEGPKIGPYWTREEAQKVLDRWM